MADAWFYSIMSVLLVSLISLVGIFTIAINIDKLENELNKPVVTSVQAMAWGALKMIGISDKITGYGQLFSFLP